MSALAATHQSAFGPVPFRVTEDAERGERLLRLEGELDLAAVPELRRRVRDAARRDGVAILDLSSLEFVDVAGLCALHALAHEARTHGWSLDLRRAPLSVRQLARLTGIDALPLAA